MVKIRGLGRDSSLEYGLLSSPPLDQHGGSEGESVELPSYIQELESFYERGLGIKPRVIV